MKLDQLPWIDVPPYDQILTDLISSCHDQDVSLICIEGSEGSGKTRLLSELLKALSIDKTIALIEFSGCTNDCNYYNIEASSNVVEFGHSEFVSDFLLISQTALSEKRHVYVLIDDADDIDVTIMKEILSTINDNDSLSQRVTLILFMRFIPISLDIQSFFKQAKIFTLVGISIAQTKIFIDHIYSTIPEKSISISEANQLNSLSYGYPGRIIKLLQQKQEQPVQKNKNNIFKLLAVFFVLSAVVLALYCWMFKSNQATKGVIEFGQQQPIVSKKEIIPVKIIPIVQIRKTTVESSADLLHETSVITKDRRELHNSLSIDNSEKQVVDEKKTLFNYVIELGRHRSKNELERSLKDRSIPGKVQFKQLDNDDSSIWVAYIGPYGSEQQAIQGRTKLPASLQSLPLKVKKEF